MKNSKILVALLISFIFISCSHREADVLRLANKLPTGVIASEGVMTLSFSKRVVPPESTNVWTTTPFIQFSPEIPGNFSWLDTTTLIFSPDTRLKGDTKYHGQINTALMLKYAGLKAFEGDAGFDFETESFTMKSAEFFYDRLGPKREVGIKANLEFTYAVNPAEVAKFIKVWVNDTLISGVAATSSQSNRVIPVEIGDVLQTDKDKTIKVGFDNQMVSTETNTRIKLDKPFEFKLPGIGQLSIYGHDFGFDGTNGWIRINTSQEVDSASVRNFVIIDPSRQYSIEGNRNSLTLRGKFEPGKSFHLLIKKGLSSTLDAKTQNDYEADITIGNIKPSFRFASAGGTYMLMGGQKKLEIKTLNMPKLFVRVSQIFQNNVVYLLENGREYDYSYGYDEEGEEVSDWRHHAKYRYNVRNFGREIDVDTITTGSVTNREVSTMFDLNRYMKNDYKGFYVVEIANPAETWRTTSKLISISNISLIVKKSGDELMVFATNLETTEPMSGVAINLISTTNQAIGTMRTTSDGVAKFESFEKLRKDFDLKLVTAEVGNDFNFINLEDYRVETSRFDVEGKNDSPADYDVFLYGDRTLYRPGEKVHLTGIIRNLHNPIAVKMPVKITITSPRGTVIKELQQTLNEQGSFELEYQTSPASLTGTYRFDVSTGNGYFLSSYEVSVEDFVPDRLKIDLKASSETAKPGDKLTYQLQALNFFGPPAAGRKYEFEGTFEAIPYFSKNFRQFRFSDEGAKNYEGSPAVITGKTDENGKASIVYELPDELTSTGILRVRGKVAVSDESNRPVYQVARTTVFPRPYFIGIKNNGDYYLKPNSQQRAQFIAVDVNDKPIAGFRAKVDVIRLEWYSVLRQAQGGALRYVSDKREIVEKTEVVTLGSQPLDYSYSAARSGEYLLRVSKEGDTGYNQFFFYSYSWGTSDITSFEIDPEARVDIVLNDSSYTPGEKAKVLFKTPFSGKLLVTIERNQVYKYRYLDVVDNAASMEIPVEENYLPNVYISAVLFRKLKDSNIPLMAGHGFVPLFVEKKGNKLNVAIKAPEKIRPKTKQTITITTDGEGNVAITLAAVDEGILQLKNYATPDPYKYFYARKALQTETFDFFKNLLPEPARSSTGGSDAALGQRVNPLGVRRFKPVALWSGIVRTNESGSVDVTFDIPDFNGELRLMAVAYKGDHFGSAQKPMKVADPVVITPALPRFLSPNDSILMPVTAFNTTDKAVKLKFEILTTGGITAIQKTASLDIGPNQEKYITVALKSTNQIGKATVKVRTTAFGEKFESETELPVRPIAPYVTEAVSNFVEGGSTVANKVTDTYLPFGRQSYITMSPFPVVNFAKELKYLIGYPHGCIEQTTSKAFPQIYLRDIAQLLDPSILNSGSPTYFVNEAITKITSMQMADGAFSYWPGGDFTNKWGTVYATHFLVEAKRAGYAVPDATLKNALNYIAGVARSKELENYYWYEINNKVSVRRIADKTTIYALFVLAMAGTPEKTIMNYYRAERSLLTTDTRYLLAASFALSGDRRTYLDLIPSKFTIEPAQRQWGEDFDSPIRANALVLNVLLESDLSNPDIAMYMDYLSKEYKADRWYSTQDDAFTLLAFGKAARMAAATKVSGTVKVGTKEYAYKGGTEKFDIDPFGKTVSISIKGTGRIYYSLVTTGIRSDGKIPVMDKNLQVRREFFKRDGSVADLSSIKQNDLLIVKITLVSSVVPIDYIAISDLLPAGFEIENSRLGTTTNYSFIKNPSTADYMDIRDDRINFYLNVDEKKPEFFYMVRAVTAGVYNYAPVAAEAMYDGNYYSASGGGKIRIAQ